MKRLYIDLYIMTLRRISMSLKRAKDCMRLCVNCFLLLIQMQYDEHVNGAFSLLECGASCVYSALS